MKRRTLVIAGGDDHDTAVIADQALRNARGRRPRPPLPRVHQLRPHHLPVTHSCPFRVQSTRMCPAQSPA